MTDQNVSRNDRYVVVERNVMTLAEVQARDEFVKGLEASVLQAARNHAQARRDWAQAYLIERMLPGKTAKDAEAAADEACIRQVIETDALLFIAKHRLGGTTDADPG